MANLRGGGQPKGGQHPGEPASWGASTLGGQRPEGQPPGRLLPGFYKETISLDYTVLWQAEIISQLLS